MEEEEDDGEDDVMILLLLDVSSTYSISTYYYVLLGRGQMLVNCFTKRLYSHYLACSFLLENEVSSQLSTL
jgi:hypothetical protein